MYKTSKDNLYVDSIADDVGGKNKDVYQVHISWYFVLVRGIFHRDGLFCLIYYSVSCIALSTSFWLSGSVCSEL